MFDWLRSRLSSQIPTWMLRSTLDNAIDAVVLIDTGNKVTYFNAAAEKLWNCRREDVIGRNVKMLVPKKHQGHHDQLIDTNRNTGVDRIVGSTRRLTLERRDGTEATVTLALSKMPVGKSWAYAAIVRDISEETQMMDSLLTQAADSAAATMSSGCEEMRE